MLDKNAYLYPTGYEQIVSESANTNQDYLIDIKRGIKEGYFRSEPTPDGQATSYFLVPQNGVFLPVKNAIYPVKAFPDPNAIFAANLVKAHIIETIKLVSKWYLVPFLLLINKQNALDAFNRIAFKAMSAQLLKDNYLTDFSREFKVFVSSFLKDCGFTKESSDMFALIFIHLIEFDNVYRLRLADTFSETTLEKMSNPRKEIKRLTEIMRNREVRPDGKGEAIHRKFSATSFLIRTALLIPLVKRAYMKALGSIDIENLKLDTIDIYWVCFRNDYKFMGLTDEERQEYALKKGWTYPIPMNKNDN